jgi:hypothetical protein
MTIDKAIKHCIEVAEKQEIIAIYTPIEMLSSDVDIEKCQECASEHRQLAEWLKELKKYQAIFEKVGKILADNGYTIDDLDTIFGKVNREASTDE